MVSLSVSFRACLATLMTIHTCAASMIYWRQTLSAAVIIPGSIAHLRGIETHRTDDKRSTSIFDTITPTAASLAPTSSAPPFVPSDIPSKSSSLPSLITSAAPTLVALTSVPSNPYSVSSSVPSSRPDSLPTNNHLTWGELPVQGAPPNATGDQWQTTWNGDILIVGGKRQNENSTEFPEGVFVLKNLTTWERLDHGDGPPGRYAAAEGVYEDKLFIYGGLGENSISEPFVYSETWVFDLREGTWRLITNDSPPGKRLWATGAVYDDRMYVYGGSATYPDYTELSGVWYLDMVKETWGQLPVNQPPWEYPTFSRLRTSGTTAVTAKLNGTPYLVQIGGISNPIRMYGDIRLLPVNEEITTWESLSCTGGENFITGSNDAAGYRAVVLDESETISVLIVGRKSIGCSTASQWILTILPEKSCQLVPTLDFSRIMPPYPAAVNMARTEGGVVVYGGINTCASEDSSVDQQYPTKTWLLTYNATCVNSCLSLIVHESGAVSFVYKNGVPNSVVYLAATYKATPGEAIFRGEPGLLTATKTTTNNEGNAVWISLIPSPPPVTIWMQAIQQNDISNVVVLDSTSSST